MRISTNSFQDQWLSDIYQRQTDLARVQKQVTTGKQFSTAADNPSGVSQSITLQQGIARLQNFAANAETARRRLSLEENSLSTFGDSLTRVRELAVEAGDGNLSPESKAAIATELQQILNGLVSTANSQDGEGRYLFSGSQVTTTPFVKGAGGVTYTGDDGVQSQRIADGRTVQENDSGADVFQRIRNGNGVFTVAPAATNQGDGYLASSTVTTPGSWVPGNYTLTFDSQTSYVITDAGGATVGSGAWAPGQAISLNGGSITIDGQPSTGDSFNIGDSRNQDVFATVQNLINTLNQPVDTPAGHAKFQSALNNSLADIDQAQNHISLVQSQLGGRLNAIDDQTTTNQSLSDELQKTLSTVRDVDYPKALSDLQQQLTSLDAAYQVFAKTQAHSLFDVL